MCARHASRPSRQFFRRDSLTLARALLGALLVHDSAEGVTAGRIVEVEAYRGTTDRAAHSFGGRRTPRNEVMYGPAGHAYVYFVYGMHYCFNVVAADVGIPEAVLIRALDAVEGIDLMRARRGLAPATDPACVARGPANLCRAMGITRAHNGADLLRRPLRITPGVPVPERRLVRAPRVGIAYAGPDARRLWRLYERDNPAVSGPRRR